MHVIMTTIVFLIEMFHLMLVYGDWRNFKSDELHEAKKVGKLEKGTPKSSYKRETKMIKVTTGIANFYAKLSSRAKCAVCYLFIIFSLFLIFYFDFCQASRFKYHVYVLLKNLRRCIKCYFCPRAKGIRGVQICTTTKRIPKSNCPI